MGIPETTQGSKEIPPYKRNISTRISDYPQEVALEEIFPDEDIESEKIQYWHYEALKRKTENYQLKKAVRRRNSHIRQLKREKDEISLILGEQIEEIRELRKTLMDELKRQ